MESLLSVTSARLPTLRTRQMWLLQTLPSGMWGGGVLVSDKHVWHVDTFKNCAGCIASPGVQEGAAKARQRELQRGDDGIFQSSARRWISAPRPLICFTFDNSLFPPVGPVSC